MTDLRFFTGSAYRPTPKRHLRISVLPRRQQGVVLVIALILLVLISLLAMTSVKNSSSSESVAGNVRTTELATQAADIALRHCEASVLMLKGGSSYTTTFANVNILESHPPPNWMDMSSATGWDSTATSAFSLLLASVNPPGMTHDTYQRPPECMVEKQSAVVSGASTFYIVTARGFGPEVAAADAARSRPAGSEVWLQSHIEIR